MHVSVAPFMYSARISTPANRYQHTLKNESRCVTVWVTRT